jgi:CSLREA domain-containing protein
MPHHPRMRTILLALPLIALVILWAYITGASAGDDPFTFETTVDHQSSNGESLFGLMGSPSQTYTSTPTATSTGSPWPTPSPLSTRTYNVNSVADVQDASPGDGICADIKGMCTLRAAITESNLVPSTNNVIYLPAGNYTTTLSGQPEDANESGDLDITGDVTIHGAGASTTFIQASETPGTATERVIHSLTNGVLHMDNLTVRFGRQLFTSEDTAGGGGLLIVGVSDLVLDDIFITDNISEGSGGGMRIVLGLSTVRMHRCVIRNNRAGSDVPGSPAAGGGLDVFGDPGSGTSFGLYDTAISNNIVSSSVDNAHGGGASLTLPPNGLGFNECLISGNQATTTGSGFGGYGGGVDFSGNNLNLSYSQVSDNSALTSGGGVYAQGGGVALYYSTVKDNTAGSGGGIVLSNCSVGIHNSTISGNSATAADGLGGGIYNTGSVFSYLNFITSTLSGNTASAGGGLYNDSTERQLLVDHCTIANNMASVRGGGLCQNSVSGEGLRIADSVVGDNDSPVGPDLFGTIFSIDYNHVENTDGCIFAPMPHDVTGIDALLGPLADNGGPTVTHAPLPQSPVLNTIPPIPGNCSINDQDQRTFVRLSGPGCDKGSVENYDPRGTPTNTATNTPTVTPTATASPTGMGECYTETTSTGQVIDPGTTFLTGSNCIDCSIPVSLPFPFMFYGTSYDSIYAVSNGNLQFRYGGTSHSNYCFPYPYFEEIISPHWDDLLLGGAGDGIYISTTGSAPERIFNIEWRGRYSGGAGSVNFEVRLHETTNAIEFIYGAVGQGGDSATVGLQVARGRRFSQYECDAGGLTQGLGITYTPVACIPLTPTPSATATGTYSVINTNVPGASFSVKSESYESFRTIGPLDYDYDGYTLSLTSPQYLSPDERYVWTRWSDSGEISHSILPHYNPGTYTAFFDREYFLRMIESHLEVSPISGFFVDGQTVQIQANSSGGCQFVSWNGSGNGSYTGTDNPAMVTVNGPIVESLVETCQSTPTDSPTSTPTASPSPAPFAPGNFVVCRVGDGRTGLNLSAAPVYLDEYTQDGGLVRSLAMPTSTVGIDHRLTVEGASTTECEITRSSDGRFLFITGYDAPVGMPSVARTNSSKVPRVIGRIDSEGVIDTSTTTTGFDGAHIRAAVSDDGLTWWAVGGNTGVLYNQLGTAGPGTIVSTTILDNRNLGIFNGQLFVSDADGRSVLGTVGNGLPITPGQTIVALPGFAIYASYESFFFADVSPNVPGFDTLYIASDAAPFYSFPSHGGVLKFARRSGEWVYLGAFPVPAAPGLSQFYGLAGRVSHGVVTLFTTQAQTELLKFVDSTGYNGAPVATPTLLASTSGQGTAVRGVAMAPTIVTPTPRATVPARADFDGDARTDMSVYRPSDGTWYWQGSTEGFRAVQFGDADDIPAPGDFDNDNKTDISVFRPSNGYWYRLNSSDGAFSFVEFGLDGDIPQAGDYDGDGRADQAVFRPSNGTWYWRRSIDDQWAGQQFGQNGDRPVAADYDGDGKYDLAVYRGGIWYRVNSSDGSSYGEAFGVESDVPVAGDYDGDHYDDLAVFRPSEGTWFFQYSGGQFTSMHWGRSGDTLVPGDYDGDGRYDLGVFRDGTWYIYGTSTNIDPYPFGLPGDLPIPNMYVR